MANKIRKEAGGKATSITIAKHIVDEYERKYGELEGTPSQRLVGRKIIIELSPKKEG